MFHGSSKLAISPKIHKSESETELKKTQTFCSRVRLAQSICVHCDKERNVQRHTRDFWNKIIILFTWFTHRLAFNLIALIYDSKNIKLLNHTIWFQLDQNKARLVCSCSCGNAFLHCSSVLTQSKHCVTFLQNTAKLLSNLDWDFNVCMTGGLSWMHRVRIYISFFCLLKNKPTLIKYNFYKQI